MRPLVLLALIAPLYAGQIRGPNARPVAVDAPESLVGRPAAASARGGRPVALDAPWSSLVRVGRRNGNQAVESFLNHPKKTYGNAHYEVFADVGVNISTGIPLLTNKVLSGPLNQTAGGPSFRIDFAPLLPRTGGGAVFNLDLVERLNQQGRVRLYVRVQPDPTGAASQRVERRTVQPAGARPPVRPKTGAVNLGRMFRPEEEPSVYAVVAAETQAQQMTVGQARDAFFKTLDALNQKQGEMHGLPEVSPYLAQDPDFQYRPPTMFVKVKAVADKGAEGRLSNATSFSVSCTNFWKDASYQLTNGQPLTGQLTVIDSIAQVPALPDGAEIVVPIYLAFASGQAQGDPNWGRAWFSPSASHWQIWGKTLDGSTATAWTKSF